MKMDMKRPCEHCPFRTDCLKGWLGKDRATEIAGGLNADQSFACHETTEFGDDGEDVRSDGEQHCAGAMILLEKLGRPNQWMRWMERLRLYDHTALDMTAPVFKSFRAFIAHHSQRRRRAAP